MKRKLTLIVALLLTCVLATPMITYAFLTWRSHEMVNTFALRMLETSVGENIEGLSETGVAKEVWINNHVTFETDELSEFASNPMSPAYIRARITVSPNVWGSDLENDVLILSEGELVTPDHHPGDNWLAGGDGWFYYLSVVQPDESTGLLMDYVAWEKGWAQNFDLTIYQEAVTADRNFNVGGSNSNISNSDILSHMQQRFAIADGTLGN